LDRRQFGRYVIVGELGRGAMGAVHRALDPLIERDVAIKTLLPDLPPEIMGEVRERFLREARSAGRLNHPNIVIIYDVGEQDGIAYIAMELLEGKSLQQMLREPSRLPVATAVDIVAQVAEGLDLAQRHGITHRDIKPANIMVSAAGHAKLTDFGVAHVASSSMTQTGSALGSPKYMSPEQVTGQPLDPRSDIFSLGVVLYEALVRRTPFERSGDNAVFAVLHRIAAEPHVPVTRLDPALSPGLDQILERALAKSPDRRYRRAAEMAQDLRRYRELAPAGAGSGQYEKTMRVTPAARAAAPAPAPRDDAMSSTLMADLDVFAKGFERQQEEQLRAEEAERLRKQEEIQRWAEAEERRRQEFERQRDATSGVTQAGRRSAALDLLRQKAAARTPPPEDRRKAEAVAQLDARLRVAFQYLSELATALNDAQPVSEGRQAALYFGEVEGAILCEGFTDLRTRELDGKSRADYVLFRYRLRFPRPAALEVSAQQLPRVQERLKTLRIDYKEAGAKKNDFGQVTHAVLQLSGPFPCQAVLRADYDDPGFALELINVRRLGPRALRLAPGELTDEALDEFGTWVLGASDAFERRLKRA